MIRNKRDFYEYLEKKHFKEIKSKKYPRIEPRPNKLKIFLLEYIVGKVDFLDKEKVKSIFESIIYKKENLVVENVDIIEEDFVIVDVRAIFDNKKATLYIILGKDDLKRFLYFYTFADSEFIESIMKYLVKNQIFLDSFWFSTNLFREYLKNQKKGKLVGATVKQNKNYLTLRWTGDLIQYIKEITSKNNDKEIYNHVIEKSIFKSIDIETDEVRYRLSKNGKIMIFGAYSIFSVIKLLREISEFYLEHLKKVEKNNIEINFNEENNLLTISKGKSITLNAIFKDDNQNFLSDNWLNKIISLNDKYRLVGYYEKLGKDMFLAKLVDYYVGQDFHMIIFENKIEMYLQRDNCGNIFHRFVTNLYEDFEIENISYDLDG